MRLIKADIVQIAIVGVTLVAGALAVPAIASGQNFDLPGASNQTTGQRL